MASSARDWKSVKPQTLVRRGFRNLSRMETYNATMSRGGGITIDTPRIERSMGLSTGHQNAAGAFMDMGTARRKRFKVGSLIPMQYEVFRDPVRSYIRGPGDKSVFKSQWPPHVVIHKGKKMLVDGHHRYTAAVLSGRKTIDAIYHKVK